MAITNTKSIAAPRELFAPHEFYTSQSTYNQSSLSGAQEKNRSQKFRAIKNRYDFINNEEDIVQSSIMRLHRINPSLSALKTFSIQQKILGSVLLIATIIGLIQYPWTTLIIVNCFATAYYLSAIFFRVYLMAHALKTPEEKTFSHLHIDNQTLPIITILLPLRDEKKSLPILAHALANLDYPREKLDIKLILEEDDLDTQYEARELGLYNIYDVIIAPVNQPRTKPKACNQALYHAIGEYTVIYDAEDQPEPGQLKKAVAAFLDSDDKVACVQARLNYYNSQDNWLTKLFTLEYSLWFDNLLPALEKLDIPIPLGGTSNIFRTDILVNLGGWDPFNVTEDADLGLRLATLGYKTKIISSTTYEEANCDLENWLRQRSRWMKGHLQTWLVHMRRPIHLIKSVGFKGFLGIQLFLAGNVFSALINPLLWVVFIGWHVTNATFVNKIFPGPLLYFNLFALLFGNLFFVYLLMIAPLKRGWIHLASAAALAPAYWLLSSIAAYKAVWQLFTKPFYWEKTHHHISKTAIAHRQKILTKP